MLIHAVTNNTIQLSIDWKRWKPNQSKNKLKKEGTAEAGAAPHWSELEQIFDVDWNVK